MRRREFIGGSLAGAALACSPIAEAQSTKVATIGVLVLGNADPESFLRAFREGLQKVGYIDGQNIRLEFCKNAAKAPFICHQLRIHWH